MVDQQRSGMYASVVMQGNKGCACDIECVIRYWQTYALSFTWAYRVSRSLSAEFIVYIASMMGALILPL